uniref:Uncharacterized protein n=1 Tax=Populus trichocarpa TaxID=3694 RepID=A0A2K2ANY6_POPTR
MASPSNSEISNLLPNSSIIKNELTVLKEKQVQFGKRRFLYAEKQYSRDSILGKPPVAIDSAVPWVTISHATPVNVSPSSGIDSCVGLPFLATTANLHNSSCTKFIDTYASSESTSCAPPSRWF